MLSSAQPSPGVQGQTQQGHGLRVLRTEAHSTAPAPTPACVAPGPPPTLTAPWVVPLSCGMRGELNSLPP